MIKGHFLKVDAYLPPIYREYPKPLKAEKTGIWRALDMHWHLRDWYKRLFPRGILLDVALDAWKYHHFSGRDLTAKFALSDQYLDLTGIQTKAYRAHWTGDMHLGLDHRWPLRIRASAQGVDMALALRHRVRC